MKAANKRAAFQQILPTKILKKEKKYNSAIITQPFHFLVLVSSFITH